LILMGVAPVVVDAFRQREHPRLVTHELDGRHPVDSTRPQQVEVVDISEIVNLDGVLAGRDRDHIVSVRELQGDSPEGGALNRADQVGRVCVDEGGGVHLCLVRQARPGTHSEDGHGESGGSSQAVTHGAGA
jgi:hypothetical protein